MSTPPKYLSVHGTISTYGILTMNRGDGGSFYKLVERFPFCYYCLEMHEEIGMWVIRVYFQDDPMPDHVKAKYTVRSNLKAIRMYLSTKWLPVDALPRGRWEGAVEVTESRVALSLQHPIMESKHVPSPSSPRRK